MTRRDLLAPLLEEIKSYDGAKFELPSSFRVEALNVGNQKYCIPLPTSENESEHDPSAGERRVACRSFDTSRRMRGRVFSRVLARVGSFEIGSKSVGTRLLLSVLVNRVEGVDAGAYLYDPTAHALMPVRSEFGTARGAMMQPEFSDASVSLMIHYRPRSWEISSYVEALQSVGYLGHALWIAALQYGAEGCVHDGLSQDSLFELGLDLPDYPVGFALSLGYRAHDNH